MPLERVKQWVYASVTVQSNVIKFPVTMNKVLSSMAVDVESTPALVKPIGIGKMTASDLTVAPVDYLAITVWVLGAL